MSTVRVVGPLLAAVLVSQCAIPPARAVTPPAVDEKWLPPPASPSPLQRTVQRETCAVATAEPDNSDAPAQLAGFDLPQIWQLTRGSGQRVAVIDTGVHRHPRLKEVVAGGDYVSTGDGTQDCDAHGTLIAGIIGATTDPTFSGIAPDVTLISIRQSSVKFGPADNRSGEGVGDVETLARAVRTAADLGATVINIRRSPARRSPRHPTTGHWVRPWPTRLTSRTPSSWRQPVTVGRIARPSPPGSLATPSRWWSARRGTTTTC